MEQVRISIEWIKNGMEQSGETILSAEKVIEGDSDQVSRFLEIPRVVLRNC